MRWNDEQRAERAARLLHAAACIATEAARLTGETSRYSPWSSWLNKLSADLEDAGKRLTADRQQRDPFVESD